MLVWKITKIKTLLSAIFDFLFFLHSAQIHSFILNFWSWPNQPIRMHVMSFTKLKAIFQNLCKALGIPLYCTFTKIRLLHIAKIRTWIKISFQLEIFLFFKCFLNSSGGIPERKLNGKAGGGDVVRGGRGKGGEGTVHLGEFRLHHYVDWVL